MLKKQLQLIQGAFKTCWKQIHKLIESSHVVIIASFGKNKAVVQHKFKQQLWSEIRGRVSISALDLIFNSLNDLYDGDRDPLLCDCAVRSTCRLPCPHELTEYVRFNSPIPLHKIHAFWRKLDTLPIVSYEDDIDKEIRNRYKECCNTFDSRFEAEPRYGKNLIVRKLTEICYPETTVANEPEVKINNKDRPKGSNAKLDKSTACGDGNCGYRCIAELLGRTTNDWRWVRGKLFMEVTGNQELFAKLFMDQNRVAAVFHSLNWYNGPCLSPYWFNVVEMGYVVANEFNVALVSLSKSISLTFLPTRKPLYPTPKLYCIANVNGNHYIQVILKEDSPLPSLTFNWYDLRREYASGWLDYYQHRLVKGPDNSNDVIHIK